MNCPLRPSFHCVHRLQSLMAALVVLEGMVRPEFLKQQWRPFAMPTPQPGDTSEWPWPACLPACSWACSIPWKLSSLRLCAVARGGHPS